jgi:hypothetical protein
MSITIGSSSFPTLTAQPFGYDESETRNGLTAKKWTVTGLLTPQEWLDLLDEYDAWRDLRIDDPDTATSETVGTTILLSGTGPGGQEWTNVACWFSAAPQGTQSGNRIGATVELVDAAQALEILLKQEEIAETEEELDIGNITIGTTTLKLTKPADTYNQGPQAQLTLAGSHLITGPLVVERILDVEGLTDEAGWNAIRNWYEATIISIPNKNSYYPISPPTASASNKVISGVKTVEYTVNIQLIRIL